MLWSPNTQLLYPFENQANDYSGKARHGTVNGSGVYATRPNAGRCLYFDGVGDYVSTPSFGLPATHTVVVFAADVRCKQTTGTQTLMADGAQSTTVGYLFIARLPNTAHLYYQYADGAGARVAYADNFFATPYEAAWVHSAIVCDYAGKNTYHYRNGILFATVAMTGTPVFPTTARVKYVGGYNTTLYPLTDGYLQNGYLGTLLTMPPAAQMRANVNRLMLGMNPIW